MTGATRFRPTAAVVMMLFLLPVGTAAGIDLPQKDGWYRWQTTSVATAADACCYMLRNGIVERCVCNLDDRRAGMNIDTDRTGNNRLISIYVMVENGSASRIRALNSDCAVDTSTRILDLGTVDVADSIAWLQARLGSEPDLAEQVVNAIGVHGGNDSMRALIQVIENRSYRKELREHALFWLAQSNSDDAFAYLDRLLGSR